MARPGLARPRGAGRRRPGVRRPPPLRAGLLPRRRRAPVPAAARCPRPRPRRRPPPLVDDGDGRRLPAPGRGGGRRALPAELGHRRPDGSRDGDHRFHRRPLSPGRGGRVSPPPCARPPLGRRGPRRPGVLLGRVLRRPPEPPEHPPRGGLASLAPLPDGGHAAPRGHPAGPPRADGGARRGRGRAVPGGPRADLAPGARPRRPLCPVRRARRAAHGPALGGMGRMDRGPGGRGGAGGPAVVGLGAARRPLAARRGAGERLLYLLLVPPSSR